MTASFLTVDTARLHAPEHFPPVMRRIARRPDISTSTALKQLFINVAESRFRRLLVADW